MLGGVCGGIAEYLDLDPTVVRLLAVLLAIAGNAATVIVYLVMWIAVPEDPAAAGSIHTERGGQRMAEQDNATTTRLPGPDDAPPPPPAHAVPPYAAQQGSPVPAPSSRGRGGAWFGAALIFVGVALLVQMFVPSVRLWEYWPVVIIAAGVLMIVRPRGGGAR